MILVFIGSNKILYSFASVSSTALMKTILETKVSLLFIYMHFIFGEEIATDVQEKGPSIKPFGKSKCKD